MLTVRGCVSTVGAADVDAGSALLFAAVGDEPEAASDSSVSDSISEGGERLDAP